MIINYELRITRLAIFRATAAILVPTPAFQSESNDAAVAGYTHDDKGK